MGRIIFHFSRLKLFLNYLLLSIRQAGNKGNKPTIAVIGVSPLQRQLYEKARDAGFRTIGFPFKRDVRCYELPDKNYVVSATRIKKVLEICRRENVVGVVSNVDDSAEEIVSRISTELGLRGIPYENFLKIKNKRMVRDMLEDVDGLSRIWYFEYDGTRMPLSYPCVVKPCTSIGKIGLSIVQSEEEFQRALEYSKRSGKGKILVEEYVPGREISVESITYECRSQVIQITDKQTTEGTLRVEVAHHEPACLPAEISDRIRKVVPEILRRVGFGNGASHIEMKISPEGNLYLIEINPRGGGGNISNFLVEYSTGYDYVRAMIDVAVGNFSFPSVITNQNYAGIYFLCRQTEQWLGFFNNAEGKPWFVRKVIWSDQLRNSTTNFDRNGFVMYKSDHKVLPDE